MRGLQSLGWRNLSMVVSCAALFGLAIALAFDVLLVAIALIGMQATVFPMTELVSLMLSGQVASSG